MSSGGQVVGGIVGGVVGFFAGGNVMLGASIGMAIGGAIDPPKGPKIEGPRLSDTSQQTSTYGVAIPRTAGSCAVSGNVFWIENNALKEVSTTESQGKGGGGAEITNYSYFGTFAIGLADCATGERKTLGRVWIGGQLFYDPTAASLESALASTDGSQYFTFYSGADDQLPDPRMQAALGVNDVPAYRGLCYIVFKDLPLADYMNTIVGTRIKVELFDGVGVNHNEVIGTWPATGNYGDSIPTITRVNDSLFALKIGYSSPSNDLVEVVNYKMVIGSGTVSLVSRAPLPSYPDVYFGAHLFCNVRQSDFQVGVFHRYLNTNSQIIGFDSFGNEYFNTGSIPSSTLPYPLPFCAIDGNDLFFCTDTASTRIYKVEGGLHDLSGPGPAAVVVASPVLSYPSGELGVSENYVFCLIKDGSTTSCTVVKLNRIDMTVAATYTQPVSSLHAKLSVISDSVFYTSGTVTAASVPIKKWVDGVVVDMDYPLQANNSTWTYGSARMFSVNDLVHYFVEEGTVADTLAVFGSVSGSQTTLGEIVSAECLHSKVLSLSDIDTSALTQSVRGYKVQSIGAIRSTIEPLQGCWPFDIVQSGYAIKFIPRGESAVASISESELDARPGSQKNGVRMTKAREMSLQIPRRVEVTYIDAAREYEIGPAGTSERLNTDSVNILAIEMPVVLTADEAQGKAETLLYLYWLERNDLSFTLPPTYAHLEPADVVTILLSGETLTVRLVGINYLPDGRLEVQAKMASSAIYSPNTYGQAGLSTGAILTLDGASGVIPLDIPCMMDEMNTSGCPIAIYGERTGWPGGTAVRSFDAGQTWASIASVTPPSITWSRAINALPVGRTDIFDTTNTLLLQPTTNALSSVTSLQVFAGANNFAVGADGRWEIIGAMTCTQHGDGSWVLSDLLRGRFGTEWAMSLHQALDTVVLLDPFKIPFVTLPTDRIFAAAVYRGVTNGATLDSASDVNFTYNGVNFECLSPVYINGGIDGVTKDWTVTWLRRTRIWGEWRDYVDAPLSETSEIYDAEIWDSTFSNLKRTFSGLTSASFTWTAAQQVTDFLLEQQTIHVRVYQLSEKVGRGYPAQASLTRALYVAPDPYWTNVSCLLHGDGVDGTNNFVDKKGKTVTASGLTRHETDSFKWGGSSIYFPGASNISVARHADFGFPADASIEFWINPDSNTVGSQVVYSSAANLSQKSIGLRIYRVTDTTWTPNLLLYPSTLAGTSGCITSGTWQFFQIIRSGNSVNFYRNGTNVGTFTYTAGDTYDTYCTIGTATDGAVPYKGYIDDFRITKGVARASGTPTAAFPDA